MLLNVIKTLPRDLTLIKRHGETLLQLKKIEKNRGSVGKLFDAYASKNPERICFYFQDKTWTFKKVQDTSNQIANFFLKEGLRRHESVSLFMENRPEYVLTWLGLCKIGVIPALVNFNLRDIPLKHCFELSKPKAIICGNELSTALQQVYPNDELKVPVYTSGDGSCNVLKNSLDLEKGITGESTKTPVESEALSFLDDLFYIYTSGTTGLPKAAIIKHSRFLMAAVAGHNMNRIREEDIIYTTLPLYHTAAGILGISQTLICGSSMALRHKFSAKQFWKDCIRYKATAAQYMGETCRYLLRQPPSPEEKLHKVRVMFGNGLRHEIWEEYVRRFNIKQISEIYGSTEGNASFVNFTNHVGAVGFLPIWLQKVFPLAIIKLDKNEEPIRDPTTGLIAKCKLGEPGELVSQILMNHPFRDYKGYASDPKATQKKVLYDVFEKGDSAFRTGDIFTKDELGFLYFKDRMGDTFKWKGENVSTTEVEYIISGIVGLEDCVVFGVKIEDSDGQAGMVAIADPQGSLDINALAEGVNKSLPMYARPLFVRLVKEIEMTGTHKMKKSDLQKDGFDLPKLNKDKVFFLSKGKYIPLDEQLYKKIITGQMNL